MQLLYLRPSSPDFNPIEEGFSAMKAWLKDNRDFVLSQLPVPKGLSTSMGPFSMLWEALYDTMTP